MRGAVAGIGEKEKYYPENNYCRTLVNHVVNLTKITVLQI
jgi:hypothetical protein